jgi:PEP-CTERM motif
MKNSLIAGVLSLGMVGSYAQFTAGDLAVVHVGDGTTTLNGLGNNVAIDDYSTLGALTFSVNIPQTGGSPFSMTGNATAEGALSQSQDGTTLTFAGYQSARLSSGTLAGSAASAVPRAIGQVTSGGIFSMPVVSTTAFSANSFRSAVTDGANNYWGSGVGTGVTYMGNNAAAATIETAQTTLRVMNIVNGNLFFTAAGALYQVTGEPQSGTATPTAVITTTGTGVGSASSYDFAFNSLMTIAYVADDRSTVNGGGIQRWDWNGTAWALSYTLNSGGTGGARGLAVDFSGANPIVYATTTESANNRLIKITDTGSGSLETDLATAGANKAFRGLDFTPVPEPSSVALLALAAVGFVMARRRKG